MINKILKSIKKMRNLKRVELEDLELYLEMEVNNGRSEKELWKKAKEFVKN